MFTLNRKEDGTAVTMKNGKPFTYSTRELALLGKKFLEADRKEILQIVGP